MRGTFDWLFWVSVFRFIIIVFARKVVCALWASSTVLWLVGLQKRNEESTQCCCCCVRDRPTHTHFEVGECGKSLSYIEYIQLTSILRAEKCSLCRISGQSTRLCLALAITVCQLARSKSNEQTRIYNTTTEHISPSISYVMLCSPVNCSVKLHIARCT